MFTNKYAFGNLIFVYVIFLKQKVLHPDRATDVEVASFIIKGFGYNISYEKQQGPQKEGCRRNTGQIELF